MHTIKEISSFALEFYPIYAENLGGLRNFFSAILNRISLPIILLWLFTVLFFPFHETAER